MTLPRSHQIILDSRSPADTRRIAQMIGEIVPPGLVLTVQGDLGSGKTCFVQGLAR
ncbi:MAG: tRNA (adenosine(37)-N6)-threonylcarbamoyltransferase complex ATPase subunit type 1 TsaE, partial [Desulfosarcina sp.]|nr:tRNA (adenosine(37)-N6)-threonylcarbamoyltransferase complex ATPase subunit type 1 TsaE [Desulfobacterales bacterium]